MPRVDAASSAGGRETEERGRVIFLSLEDVREAEREKEREREGRARAKQRKGEWRVCQRKKRKKKARAAAVMTGRPLSKLI